MKTPSTRELIDLLRSIYNSAESAPLHCAVLAGSEREELIACIELSLVFSMHEKVTEVVRQVTDFVGSLLRSAVSGSNTFQAGSCLKG